MRLSSSRASLDNSATHLPSGYLGGIMSFEFDPDVQEQLMKQKVPCPICMKQFTLLEIEAHSDTCLENSAKAIPAPAVFSRPNPTPVQPRPVVVASRPGPVSRPAPVIRKPVYGGGGEEKASVDMDPELDFETAVEQAKMKIKHMGSVDSDQVLKMLDGLRRKYAQEKDEPEWVKVTYDDTAEDIGGKPEFINKHDLDGMR
jgi:hypothetical protein